MGHKNHHFLKSVFFLGILVIVSSGMNCGLWAEEETSPVKSHHTPLVFSTWEGFEVDKCAAIWLIKRFVDDKAKFKFFPKGEIITEGIPFDTPDAEMRRTQTYSTFESIARKYAIKDDAVQKMGSIINDIEVNVWGKKVYQESRKIKDDIIKIISTSKDHKKILDESDAYFEKLYMDLQNKNTPNNSLQ